jgi:hypothetical protein
MNESKIIANIFSPKFHSFTHIKEDTYKEMMIKNLVLFDLNHPIIIDIYADLDLFLILLRKFNKKGNFMLKHINLIKKFEVDGLYQVMKDFVYINYNALHLKNDFSKSVVSLIEKENVKIFYFKNLMICFNLELKENYRDSFISNILIEQMKFIYIKESEKFYEINKKKKSLQKGVSLDDNTIYEYEVEEEQDGDIYINNMNIPLVNYRLQDSQFNCNNEISDSFDLGLSNMSQSDSKIKSDTMKLIKKEEDILKILQSRKSNQISKFNFLNFYVNLFSYSLRSLIHFTDNLISEGKELEDMYLIIGKKEKSNFFKKVLSHEEKIHTILEEIKIKFSFLESLTLEGENKSNRSVMKMCFMEERQFLIFSEFNSYKEKFNLLIRSLLGKLKDVEMNLKKQINITEMIVKTLKIIQDDEKYIRDRQLNILFVVMTIIQFLLTPGIFLQAWFSVNIKVPLASEFENFFPFSGIVLFMIIIPIGQLYVFYKYKHLIL